METFRTIFNRRSIRKYTGQKVSEEEISQLLKAAMYAPSAGNQQPWEFIVVRDREKLKAIASSHKYAKMLPGADSAIAVCADTEKDKYKGKWVQDCSAATQNILLAAHDLSLGAVWIGIYPEEDRVSNLSKILELPEKIVPVTLISIGYPAENPVLKEERFKINKIHYDKWQKKR